MRRSWLVIPGLIIAYVLHALPVGLTRVVGLDRTSTIGGALIWLAAVPLVFLGLHWTARWTGLGGLSQLGLARHPGWQRNLALGLLLGVTGLVVNRLLGLAVGAITVAGLVPWQEAIRLLVVAIINFGFVAFTEELVYRGYVSNAVAQWLSPVWVAGLSSLLFALAHGLNGFDPGYMADMFMAGLFFWLAYRLTGSLWFSIGAHWGWDILGVERQILIFRYHALSSVGAYYPLLTHALLILAVLLLRRLLAVQTTRSAQT